MAQENNQLPQSPQAPQEDFQSLSALGAPKALDPQTEPSAAPVVSNTTSFFNNFAEGLSHGSIPELLTATQEFAFNHLYDSPKLTNGELTSVKDSRPGINIGEGVTQMGAKYLVDNYDSDKQASLIQANTSSDTFGRVTSWTGAGLGSIFDPGALATAHLAPEIMGLKRASTLADMAERNVAKIKSATASGAGYMVPGVTAGFANDMSDDDPGSFSPLDAVLQIGNGAAIGLGGGMIGALSEGWEDHANDEFTNDQKEANPNINDDFSAAVEGHAPISMAGTESASQMAATQLLNGKDVDVGNIIQQDAADQDTKLNANIKKLNIAPDQALNIVEKSRADLQDEFDKNEVGLNLNVLQDKYDTLPKADQTSADFPPDEMKALMPSKSALQTVNANQLLELSKKEVGSLENKKTAIGLEPDQDAYLTDLKQKTSDLDGWIKDQSERPLRSEVSKQKTAISKLQGKYNKLIENERFTPEVKAKRLADIKAQAEEFEPMVKKVGIQDIRPSDDTRQFSQKDNNLRERLSHHDNVKQAIENPTQTIQKAEMNKMLDNLNDSSGNFTTNNPFEGFQFTRSDKSPRSALDDTFPKEYQDELEANVDLSKEDRDEKESFVEDEQHRKLMKKAYDNAITCLTRGL